MERFLEIGEAAPLSDGVMVSTHSHDSLGWCHCAYMTSVFMNERDGMRGTDANSEFWFIARRTDDPSFAPYQDTS